MADDTGFRLNVSFDDEIDLAVREVVVEVTVNIGRSTAAFVTGDVDETVRLAERGGSAHNLRDRVEARLDVVLATPEIERAPTSSLLRILRVLPFLEQAGEVVRRIAARARWGPLLDAPVQQHFLRLSQVVESVWEATALGWTPDGASDPGHLAIDRYRVDLLSEVLVAQLRSTEGRDPLLTAEATAVVSLLQHLGHQSVGLPFAPAGRSRVS